MADNQVIRVSSDKFTSKVGEEITIEVPSDIINRPVKTIRLLDALIPNTFSTVPADGNEFNFTDLSGTSLITIPNHNLNAASVIEVLKELLEAASGAGLTFTIIYHSCSGNYEFQADGNYTFDFTVPNSAGPLLGFNSAVYNAVETPPASNDWIISSDRRGGFDSDKYVNITSNLVTGVDQGVVFLDGNLTPAPTNIIASIPISDTGAGGTLAFSESQDAPDINVEASVLGRPGPPNQDTIREVKFALSLDSGQPVDLNGASWAARFVLKYS